MPAAESRWLVEPFRIGDSEEFARLREVLEALGYREPDLCARLGLDSIYDVVSALERGPLVQELTDPQALLIRLFLETWPAPWRAVKALLSPGDLAAIQALGLLLPESTTGEECVATVSVYPTQGLFIASDRGLDPEGMNVRPPPDIVYPAIGETTQRFLRLMPQTPCGDFLELCSGTGIAALAAASRFAERAWAVDITERATRFATFNAALNGLGNVTSLEGDLFAPVAGREFDRIVAHPPYVPALEDEYVFRDGGEDGERVTWGILTGVSKHLRPGGQFFCYCLASDRRNAPLENRIRHALGGDEAGFDVILGEGPTLDPAQYYAGLARRGKESFATLERRQKAFDRLGVVQFVHGAILVRRHARPGQPSLTLRRQLSPETRAQDFQWLLDLSSATSRWDEGSLRGLLHARLRANPHAEVRTVRRNHGGEWVEEECSLATRLPFAVDAACPAWYATLFTRCDGERTGLDHLAYLKGQGLVPDDAPDAEFAQMCRSLVEHGLLEMGEFPHPVRRRG